MGMSLAVDQRTDRVVVTWPDGHAAVFHYLWLRDNCNCAECREPTAWERRYDTVGMPLGGCWPARRPVKAVHAGAAGQGRGVDDQKSAAIALEGVSQHGLARTRTTLRHFA
jgi:hypothetical protein